MSWSRDPITRDGFTSEFGRFLTNQGRIERVDGAPLRRMFIPKMTREAQKQLRDHRDFIRGQLQHYGVSFDESEFTGNGTTLLKKALEAGKCDAVPVHILALQDQLHREWFETAMPKDITAQPDWVMDAYFVRIGDRQPDRTKTTAVIKQSFPRSSEYRAGLMREAATKAEGLHHETGWGPKTQTLFMGWDSDAVKTAAEGHAAAEKKEVEAEEKNLRAQEKERQKQREKMHKGYVEIWPNLADDLSLDIHHTDEPGVFQACFDFGILEGVMIIGKDSTMVERYCSQADEHHYDYMDEDEWDDDEEEDGEDKRPVVGSKRKATAQQARGPKTAKAGRPPSHTYQLRLRCRENEGQIYSRANVGTLKFKDGNLTSFVGEAGFPCVGEAVSFTARKVSNIPGEQQSEWADY